MLGSLPRRAAPSPRSVRKSLGVLTLAVLAAVAASTPSLACGDGEAPTSCGEGGGEGGARWMLGRVVAAVQADKARALDQFAHGTGGFRTADTYVFCVGPDGVMSAHPSPILQGQDVRDLHDATGNYFIKAMLSEARTGQVSVIRYLFPKPGGTVAEAKTTYYARAGDQVCGVGVYDADTLADTDADTGAAPTTPHARVVALRAKLEGELPPGVRADWQAFLEALNQESDAQAAAVAHAREGLQAAQAALAASPPREPAAAGR